MAVIKMLTQLTLLMTNTLPSKEPHPVDNSKCANPVIGRARSASKVATLRRLPSSSSFDVGNGTKPVNANFSSTATRPSTAAAASIFAKKLANESRQRMQSFGSSSVDSLLYSSRCDHSQQVKKEKQIVVPRRRRQKRSEGSGGDPLEPSRKTSTRVITLEAHSHSPTNAKSDGKAYIIRKRKCAKTLEDLLNTRLHAELQGDLRERNIEPLLQNGIIQSVLSLTTVADGMTLQHCCRCFYYLSTVTSARRLMLRSGVIATIKLLARTSTSKARQDLAATLCHLSEETYLIEIALFEGLDKALERLSMSVQQETCRICALTLFNVSCAGMQLKNFVELLTQLLVACTKLNCPSAYSYIVKASYNFSLQPLFHTSLVSENIPRYLVNHLSTMESETQIWALRALIALCDVHGNRSQIMNKAFCHSLRAGLASPDDTVQELTLVLLLLLSYDEGNRIRICSWMPTSAILETFQRRIKNYDRDDGDDVGGNLSGVDDKALPPDHVVYALSYLLRNLADSILTHHELVEEATVSILLAMVKIDVMEVRLNALSALNFILIGSTDEVEAFADEITENLLALAESDNQNNRMFALGAFYNIACCDECRSLLMDLDSFIDFLLDFFTKPMTSDEAEFIAAIMYRLATERDHTARMLHRGFFPVLTSLALNYVKARVCALSALFLLASESSDYFPHGNQSVEGLILALCAYKADSQPTAFVTSVSPNGMKAAERSAIALLALLANTKANINIISQNGVLIIKFLKKLRRCSNDEEILTNCAYIYYCLTATLNGSEKLIGECGLEDMISLARTTTQSTKTNQKIKQLIMLAFCRISAYDGLENKLIEHGAVEAILILSLVATDMATVKALSIHTLANCLLVKHCTRSLVEHGVIWALSSMVTLDLTDTQYACAVSLCNLAANPTMLSRFIDAGAPRALIYLLQKGDPVTIAVCVKAIANLITSNRLCMALEREDVQLHLNAIFQSEVCPKDQRQLIAMILLRLTSANDTLVVHDKWHPSVFAWMEEITTMHHSNLVYSCLLTVVNFTSSERTETTVEEGKIVLRILAQVTHRHEGSMEIIELCLGILYNLSCRQHLLHLIGCEDMLSFIRSQCTMQNNQDNADRSRADPTVMKRVIEMCALILHNITCDIEPDSDLSKQVVNLGGVRILHDIYFHRKDLLETCFIAVCNISIRKVNTTRAIEDGLGEMIFHFIYQEQCSTRHYPLLSAVLRKVSTPPRNQQLLISEGISKAIVYLFQANDLTEYTCINLLSVIALLSRRQTYLEQLLQDGILPFIIQLAETKAYGSYDVWVTCFEILSNLCSIPLEERLQQHAEINIVSTITMLSECSHQQQIDDQTTASEKQSKPEFTKRADGSALGVPVLLTHYMKATTFSGSLLPSKGALALDETYIVSYNKWEPPEEQSPEVLAVPVLECKEIALTGTEAKQLPPRIKQNLAANLSPLPKETLVRDETNDKVITSATHQQFTRKDGTPVNPFTAVGLIQNRFGIRMKPERDGGDLNLHQNEVRHQI